MHARSARLVRVDGHGMLVGVILAPSDDDLDGWVMQLSDAIRATRAYWHLVLSGPQALEAVRRGLQSSNEDIRRGCTRALDHLVDADSLAVLVTMLDDDDPQVRIEAVHALACDRCKGNVCRPDARVVLSRAIDLLLHDPDRHVRSYAAELVGRWVHSHRDAADALIRCREDDPAPAVRKKAGWYAPGGSFHRKTAPRLRRASFAYSDPAWAAQRSTDHQAAGR